MISCIFSYIDRQIRNKKLIDRYSLSIHSPPFPSPSPASSPPHPTHRSLLLGFQYTQYDSRCRGLRTTRTVTNTPKMIQVHGDQFYMAVCFWYLVKIVTCPLYVFIQQRTHSVTFYKVSEQHGIRTTQIKKMVFEFQ